MAQKVKLLIESNGYLLVLKPLNKKKYTLIGGSIKQFETPIEAGIREGFEEAGLTLSKSDFSTCFFTFSNARNKSFRFYCYLLNKDDIVFELREKHKFQSLQWVPTNKAIALLRGMEKCGAEFFYPTPRRNEKLGKVLKQAV